MTDARALVYYKLTFWAWRLRWAKNWDCFSGRKVALLLTVLQFPLKACQTGAPFEKVKNNGIVNPDVG